MFKYAISGLFGYLFLSLFKSSNSESSSSVSIIVFSFCLRICSPMEVADSFRFFEVEFVLKDEKLDEVSLLLPGSQLLVKYLTKFSVIILDPY